MKYEEYQIWYHTYNAAISAILGTDLESSTQGIIYCADCVANHALEKFKGVDIPKTELPPEFKSIVEQATKEAFKRAKK